jgi:hypothetical protein
MPPGMAPGGPYDPREMAKRMQNGGRPDGAGTGMPPGMAPGGPYDPREMAKRMRGGAANPGGTQAGPPDETAGGDDEGSVRRLQRDAARRPSMAEAGGDHNDVHSNNDTPPARSGKSARPVARAKADQGDGNTWKWFVGGALVVCGFVVTVTGVCLRG